MKHVEAHSDSRHMIKIAMLYTLLLQVLVGPLPTFPQSAMLKIKRHLHRAVLTKQTIMTLPLRRHWPCHSHRPT